MAVEEDMIEQIRGRLETVLDPCSCMTNRPLSIVELGLIEKIDVVDGSVTIELVPTSPVCLYMAQIIEEVEAAIGSLEGVDGVTVSQTLEVLWRPERMDEQRWREKQEAAEGRLSKVSAGAFDH